MHQMIPLNQLKHTENNVRKVSASKDGLKSLVASIDSQGVLHNLVVKPNGSGYIVIDGNRRLQALKHLYGDSSANQVPCVILDDTNETEIGLHANMMREDMHPLDECDAIYQLVSDGEEDFDSVGKRFGQTKKWVEQRVALSELSDLAKEMFRDYKFGIGVAMALTLGDKDKQDAFLKDKSDHSLSADFVRRYMTNSKIATDYALFDLSNPSQQTINDLGIESDLFSEESYITNIEKFEEYQEAHIQSLIQAKKNEGYMDVIYLKDEYWFDSPATQGFKLVQVYDEETYSPEDLLFVFSYNSNTFQLSSVQMISKEMEEQTTLDQDEEPEEEQELNPMLMSKPQQDLLKGYYADYVKSCWWDNYSAYLEKLMKALLCHRRMGYTYSTINRVGNVYADYQNMFPPEEKPDGYDYPKYEHFIDKHIEACRVAYENDSTAPLHYCLNLSDEELNKLFCAVCLTSLSKHDMLNEVIKEVTPDFTTGAKWFKPDTKWLNKYKVEQIAMLEDYVFGKVSNASKKERVKALSDQLSSDAVFDPFGDWPQFKPQ